LRLTVLWSVGCRSATFNILHQIGKKLLKSCFQGSVVSEQLLATVAQGSGVFEATGNPAQSAIDPSEFSIGSQPIIGDQIGQNPLKRSRENGLVSGQHPIDMGNKGWT
jgi:hypothetical protein